jgi:release factor glutamine methyltransferase
VKAAAPSDKSLRKALVSTAESSLSFDAVVAALRSAGCVFAEDEAHLLVAEARTPEDLSAMLRRRVRGLPLEHVLGWAEFAGLRVAVDPGVFVPRRRTELLVREAVALAASADDEAGAAAEPTGPLTVVDLCCGTGAVGAAVVTGLSTRAVALHAADIDPAAVACARRNLADLHGHVYQGDLYDPLPGRLRGNVDIFIANAPYVPTEAIALLPAEARDFEPRAALDGGPDGLSILRRVVERAPHWLAPGGHLLFEASERQAPGIVEFVEGCGLRTRTAVCDELEATAVVATRMR